MTSTLGMGALVYAFIRAGSNGWDDAGTAWSIALAVALLATFVFIEMRHEQPIMPLHLLASRSRVSAFAQRALHRGRDVWGFFFLTQYLQSVMGFSPVETGIAFLPMTLSIFTVSRIVPRLIPRLGAATHPHRWGLTGRALDALADADLHLVTLLPSIILPMILLGAGVGSSFLPLSLIVLSGVPGKGGRRGLWDAANNPAGGRSAWPEHPGDGLWDGDPRGASSSAGRRGSGDARGDRLHPRGHERLRPRGDLRSALVGQWPLHAAGAVALEPAPQIALSE